MRPQHPLSVGIFSAPAIRFRFLKPVRVTLPGGKSCRYEGRQQAHIEDGRIAFDGGLFEELHFLPDEAPGEGFAEASFELSDVTIGVDFHWQRKETQRFAGSLKLFVTCGRITAVNCIGVEDYLRSVIASEMKATASPEFLKAHAVISRSWLLAQIERRKAAPAGRPEFVETEDTLIRWADREDHTDFDVCADDHCQRYQGLSRLSTPRADEAVAATWGEVLTCDGALCDTRFSKCCGGMTERFSTCWENRDFPYLTPVRDAPAEGGADFCDTADTAVLSQVLNDYDLETRDFYRWRVAYEPHALAELIRRRSGIDFGGEILALEPLERGASGRISLLRIVGSARTMVFGKELTIRRFLSESHLKSSAFDVSRESDRFILQGRGWGHGVGLCQIGAAVMGHRGYAYSEILAHYFPGTKLSIR